MTSPVAGLPKFTDTSPNTPWLHFDAWAAKLDPLVTPHFTTTTERDNAYAAFVTAGGTMKAGLLCTVAGVVYKSTGTSTSAWARLAHINGSTGQPFTTSGGGDVLIPHGLGVTPTMASVTVAGAGVLAAQFGKAAIATVSSTVISCRLHDSRDGSAMAGFNFTLAWMAAAL